jgi:hypothetical protein
MLFMVEPVFSAHGSKIVDMVGTSCKLAPAINDILGLAWEQQ